MHRKEKKEVAKVKEKVSDELRKEKRISTFW